MELTEAVVASDQLELMQREMRRRATSSPSLGASPRRSEKDAELLYEAREKTKGGGRMTREQVRNHRSNQPRINDVAIGNLNFPVC